MLELGRAVARPGQTEIVACRVIAGFFVLATLRTQGFDVEKMHVSHVRFEALRALAGVPNCPAGLVDFTQDIFGYGFVHALDLLHLVILGQLFGKAQFFSELMHDHVVTAAFPQRLDDLLAPLQRTVRRRDRAAGLKLSGRRQQINRTVRIQVFGIAGHGCHGSGG